jgi:hypothetical protein
MPGDNFDHEKYLSRGGCMGKDIFDPDIGCKKCDWSGERNLVDHFYDLELDIENSVPPVQTFKYEKGRIDSHTLKLSSNLIEMDSYLGGSITGGTGTECFHKIKDEQIQVFLKIAGLKSIDALSQLMPTFKGKDWSKLHKQVHANQSEGFVWSETNWDE